MTKIYSRKCIVTHKIYPIENLLRFVLLQDKKTIKVDFDIEIQGRGAYVLKDKEKIIYLLDRKALNKAFKMNIAKEQYEALRKEVVEIWQKKYKENLI